MTICPKCNTELPNTATTCCNCGAKLQAAENRFLKQVNINNNPNMKVIATLGKYTVYEHQKDLSCDEHCINAYFAKEMNVKKRQVLVTLNGDSTKIQAGAMQ